jgi:hypothetical protein
MVKTKSHLQIYLHKVDTQVQSHLQALSTLRLTLEGQFDQKRVDAIFQTFRSPSLVCLFTMKHFLEVDNEVILLSNGWIWYL